MTKLKLNTIILCLFMALTASAQNQRADSIIGGLLNKNDMLELNRTYPILKQDVHPFLQCMTNILLANSLNNPTKTCSEIENLLKNYQVMVDFPTLVSMIYLWANNMQYIGRYQESVDLINDFLKDIPTSEKKNVAPLYSTVLRIGNALKEYPATTISYKTTKDNILPIKFIPALNNGTLMALSATINGETEDFIFDTGAEGNAVSEDFAEKHNIKIITDSITTLGVTQMYSKLGFIDSLTIGNIVYKNIPVNILPASPDDKILKIDGILGLPFLKAIKEIRIYPYENCLIIPHNGLTRGNIEPNLLLSNNQLCIEATLNGEKCLFNFDSGSVSSYLNSEYFHNNKEYIKRNGNKIKRQSGGFGSIDSMDIYKIPIHKIEIGNKTFERMEMNVLTSDYLIDQRAKTIGTLGFDLLLRCNEIIINVDSMYVSFFDMNTSAKSFAPIGKFKNLSLYTLLKGRPVNQHRLPPSATLPLNEPMLFFRINNKWGNLQKTEYVFDSNTMRWQSSYTNTLIRINK